LRYVKAAAMTLCDNATFRSNGTSMSLFNWIPTKDFRSSISEYVDLNNVCMYLKCYKRTSFGGDLYFGAMMVVLVVVCNVEYYIVFHCIVFHGIVFMSQFIQHFPLWIRLHIIFLPILCFYTPRINSWSIAGGSKLLYALNKHYYIVFKDSCIKRHFHQQYESTFCLNPHLKWVLQHYFQTLGNFCLRRMYNTSYICWL
jgi:hypothetical protein